MRRMMAIALIIPLCGVAALPSRATEPAGGRINTLQEMFDRLKSCWRSPALARDDPGMQITVVFSFKRNGELLGEPRITYESSYAGQDKRQMFRMAVAEALQRCTPMPISDGLGNAIAGRPLSIRFDARRMNSI